MSRVSAPIRLRALLVAALALPALALVAPAHAEESALKATRTYLATFNVVDNETIVGLAANVTPDPAPSGSYNLAGTVTFTDDDGTVLATGVPVTSDNGYSQVYVPKPTAPTTFIATFHGTDGWADSSGERPYTPTSKRTVTVRPEPTLLKVTAGSPKLTLTLAAYARFNDGTPAPGVTVYFSGGCLIPGGRMCSVPLEWCSAVTDANGLASCKGAGLLGAIVSILNGDVYISAHSYNSSYYVVTSGERPPVIVRS